MGSNASVAKAAPSEQSVALSAVGGESPIHRNPTAVSQLSARFDKNVATVWDNFARAVRVSGSRPFLGTRTFEEGGERGPYVYKSYAEIAVLVEQLSSYYAQLGVKRGDRVGIYAINREEWVVAEYACYRISAVPVSIYDTLSPTACEYIINHAELAVVVASADKVANVAKVCAQCACLKHVISMDRAAPGETGLPASVTFTTWRDALQKGASDKRAADLPQADDVATVMYTSGTTGDPKGVILAHSNIIATMTGGLQVLRITDSDVHFSYLPLAHIFERIVHVGIISGAAAIAFFQGNILKVLEDLAIVQPTIFAGVPRVYNRFYDRVMMNLRTGGLRGKLALKAYAKKLEAMEKGEQVGRFWARILTKVRDRVLGPRIRLLITGSAPLSAETSNFLRAVFNCQFAEGYGLTETAAAVTLSLPDDPTPRQVGPPLICSEIKLVDVPEMNYVTSHYPQEGEIMVRGPNVFRGYFKNQSATDEVLSRDGWFATGDIGRWNPKTGTLSIIDRKKNIFKLSQGEFVVADRVESAYALSPYIAQIFVYGDPFQASIVAVVVPNAEYLESLEKQEGLPPKSLLKAAELKKRIMEDMNVLAKKAKLLGFETVRDIYVERDIVWSVDNDLLTPTFKTKRVALQKKYQGELAQLYKNMSASASTSN